jgi:RimJ/RimL family protein N-acetyltransferase
MGRIEPRAIRCGGEPVWVRTAEEADAAGTLALQEHMFANNAFIVTERGENQRDPGQQAEWIRKHLEEPGNLYLVATVEGRPGGEVLGSLLFRCGDRRKTRHQGMFGIAVRASWRGRGIGTGLVECLLDWAVANEQIEKVCLGVFDGNEGARALYRRLGFVEEGRIARHFRTAQGQYADDILMGIFVKPGLAPAGYATWRSGGGRGAEGVPSDLRPRLSAPPCAPVRPPIVTHPRMDP